MSKKINDLVIAELKRFTYKEVLKSSASEKIAYSCVNATIKCIGLNFKRGNIYIPVTDENEREEERNKVRSEFNRNNYSELAIKYKRSVQWVYGVVKTGSSSKPKKAVLMEIIEDYLPEEFILLGVNQEEAKTIAKSIAQNLRQAFPGISFYVNKNTYK